MAGIDRKEQRKRQLLRRMILFGLIVIIGLFAGISVLKNSLEKKASKKDLENAKTVEEADSEDSSIDEEIALAKERAKAAGAPEDILELLDKNPETVAFVANYETLKDNPPAETVEEAKEGEIPHLLQWDERWGYQNYGVKSLAASGCGPTCISMIIIGLTGDASATPYCLAQYSEEYGYMIDKGGSYAGLVKHAAEAWGITVAESLENEDFVYQETQKGYPLICNLSPGEYFTDVGHFIVITGYEDGMITVLDPFSIENTEKTWKYSDIQPQIEGLYSYHMER